jgi:hypothetical protein
MFEFLKRKKPPPPSVPLTTISPLFFKDSKVAFEYCCELMQCPLAEGCFLPALVQDSRMELGTAIPMTIQDDGSQFAHLLVASSDGGFKVAAMTAGPKGPMLQPGQLIVWRTGKYVPEVARAAKEKRFGWEGLIKGTLKPEFVDGGWVGGEKFSR